MPAVLRTLDPKLVATVVTYLLTLLVTKVIAPQLGVNPEGVLNDVLIPDYLRVDQAIALAAAAVAGFWKANDGTDLRTPQESGNAELPDPDVGIHTPPRAA